MPMFLALPYMLRHGVNFWLAMLAACTLTVLLPGITVLIAARFGVKLYVPNGFVRVLKNRNPCYRRNV